MINYGLPKVMEGDLCPICGKGKLIGIVDENYDIIKTVYCKNCKSTFPRKDFWKTKIGQL